MRKKGQAPCGSQTLFASRFSTPASSRPRPSTRPQPLRAGLGWLAAWGLSRDGTVPVFEFGLVDRQPGMLVPGLPASLKLRRTGAGWAWMVHGPGDVALTGILFLDNLESCYE